MKIARVLYESLSRTWREVIPLVHDDAVGLYQTFAETCIRAVYHNFFFANLNGAKPLTERVFKKNTPCEFEDSVDVALPASAKAEVNVDVLWGSLRSLVGFRLLGRCQPIHNVFVLEGDAVARIMDGKHHGWLFLSGARGELRAFRE